MFAILKLSNFVVFKTLMTNLLRLKESKEKDGDGDSGSDTALSVQKLIRMIESRLGAVPETDFTQKRGNEFSSESHLKQHPIVSESKEHDGAAEGKTSSNSKENPKAQENLEKQLDYKYSKKRSYAPTLERKK